MSGGDCRISFATIRGGKRIGYVAGSLSLSATSVRCAHSMHVLLVHPAVHDGEGKDEVGSMGVMLERAGRMVIHVLQFPR